jgi:hypothetical protein
VLQQNKRVIRIFGIENDTTITIIRIFLSLEETPRAP